MANVAAMVGVRRSSAGNHPHEVPAYDTGCFRTANAARRLWCNSARTHTAQTAAYAIKAKLTHWLLLLPSVFPQIKFAAPTPVLQRIEYRLCGGFHGFYRGKIFPSFQFLPPLDNL